MSIQLHCESCGKTLQAPREAVGTHSKCPACGHDVYVATPTEEIEELPLSPEDNDDLQREAKLQAERRMVDRLLAQESALPEESVPETTAWASREAPTGIEKIVLDYLSAMRDSNLDRANQILADLKEHTSEALKVIDRLVADQLPPAEMAQVPPTVYQGFLKNLRSQL